MSSVAYIVSTFERQFERKGAGYIYRKNLRGAPIRVTADERDAFVADFRRNFILMIVVNTAAVGVAMLLAIWLGGLGDGADPVMVGLWIAIGAAVMIGGLAVGAYRINDAPARALAGRAAEGRAMTRDEARRMTFDSIGYGTLAMVAVLGLGLTAFQAIKHDIWHGWGRLLWLPAILFTGLSAIQAVRKWRFERTR